MPVFLAPIRGIGTILLICGLVSNLKIKNLKKYSPEQEAIFQKIKALHQSGLGYRKIAHKLNAENLTTHKGKKWGGNNVYSVLKRHKEREEMLNISIDKDAGVIVPLLGNEIAPTTLIEIGASLNSKSKIQTLNIN